MFLNNIKLLIIRSHLSTAQLISSFTWLNTCTPTLTTPTLITKALHRATSLQLLKMTYSETTTSTVLAYSYWDNFYDTYACLCHAH